MLVCDRCRKNEAKYRNYFIASKGRDLCIQCEKEYRSIEKDIDEIEQLFMTNVKVKIMYRSEDK